MKYVRLIYFSATGTTRKVLEAIALGIAAETIEYVDLTSAKTRAGVNPEIREGLTLIGVPVYTGRVPIQAGEALQQLKATGTPAIIAAVYGNRAYDDALLELRDIAKNVGFIPLAGAVFVGEHSFSTEAIPIASGRPDTEDLAKARTFGKLVREKLGRIKSLREVPPLDVPGNLPYRDRISLGVSPETWGDLCTLCRKCEKACSQNAITVDTDRIATDKAKCILCCACVKGCPTGARRLIDPRVVQLVEKLTVLCRDRKEPQFFFAE